VTSFLFLPSTDSKLFSLSLSHTHTHTTGQQKNLGKSETVRYLKSSEIVRSNVKEAFIYIYIYIERERERERGGDIK
jgi:hypothetical protein